MLTQVCRLGPVWKWAQYCKCNIILYYMLCYMLYHVLYYVLFVFIIYIMY